jgi:RNA polymerase sigma factor (sigma-70 family)
MAADPIRLDAAQARFEDLYRQYAADVYRYALAIMRNPADAEDVVQATFMNAWRAYSAGEEPRAPLNWFITIAHNVCRLRFRTKSRRPREVEFEPALAESPVQDGPSARDVLDALAELPLNQRAALVMRELEGRSYGEIASILGVSRSAVETLIFRARRSLRIKREAIRALALLPLPQSLASFVRGSGAAEVGAAAGLLGSGAVAKVVAVLAAGAVAAGVGKEALRADARTDAPADVPARVEPAAAPPAAPVRSEPAQEVVAPRTKPRPARPARPAPKPKPVRRVGGGRPATIEDAPPAAGPAPPPPPPTVAAAPAPPPADPPAPPPAAESPAPPAAAPPPRRLPPPLPEVRLPELPAVPPVAAPPLPKPQLPPVVPPVELPPVELPPVQLPAVELAPPLAAPALP